MKFRSIRQFSFELLIAFLMLLVFLARPDWAVAFLIGCVMRPALDRSWRGIWG